MFTARTAHNRNSYSLAAGRQRDVAGVAHVCRISSESMLHYDPCAATLREER